MHTTPLTTTALVPVSAVRTHRRKARPDAARVVRAQEGGSLADLRVPDLMLLARTRGLKVTTKHTRVELLAMLTTGQYVRPAALDRQNKKRAQQRAASSMAA